jgi:hypothetical protein
MTPRSQWRVCSFRTRAIMPEYRECLAHYLFLVWLWHKLRNDCSWTLTALWADSTTGENQKSRKQGNNDGHVRRLDATCTAVRGQTGDQTPLWPPMWAKSKTSPNPPSVTSLRLCGIERTNRAIILDLGKLHLKVSSSVVNIYS